MSHLLHIDSSSRPGSVSRALAAAYRTEWEAELPQGTVVYRDLVADPVPHLDVDATVTLIQPPDTPAQQAAAALHDTLVEEILGADALLVSAPMYNWTIPSNLKAWLDQSLIMGRTLPYDPSANPLAGTPATVVLAYGGEYLTDTEEGALNHLEPYLRTVFETVLGMDLAIFVARMTVTALISEDPTEIAKAERYRSEAEVQVQERARKVAAQVAAGQQG